MEVDLQEQIGWRSACALFKEQGRIDIAARSIAIGDFDMVPGHDVAGPRGRSALQTSRGLQSVSRAGPALAQAMIMSVGGGRSGFGKL